MRAINIMKSIDFDSYAFMYDDYEKFIGFDSYAFMYVDYEKYRF